MAVSSQLPAARLMHDNGIISGKLTFWNLKKLFFHLNEHKVAHLHILKGCDVTYTVCPYCYLALDIQKGHLELSRFKTAEC